LTPEGARVPMNNGSNNTAFDSKFEANYTLGSIYEINFEAEDCQTLKIETTSAY
jgi:hypothetical protein